MQKAAKGPQPESHIYSDILHFFQSYEEKLYSLLIFLTGGLYHGVFPQHVSQDKVALKWQSVSLLHLLFQETFHLDLSYHFFVTENHLEE